MMTSPILAHNPAGLVAAFFTTALLLPLSYAGISLLFFFLGGIGSGCGIVRRGVAALFCSMLIFFLLFPLGIWLEHKMGGGDPATAPEWLAYVKALFAVLAMLVPLWIGRVFTKLNWLRSSLITLGITLTTVVVWILLIAFGICLGVMSQVG